MIAQYLAYVNCTLGECKSGLDSSTKVKHQNVYCFQTCQIAGLNPPLYGIEFEKNEGKKKILLGATRKNGSEIFARIDGIDEVFTVS